MPSRIVSAPRLPLTLSPRDALVDRLEAMSGNPLVIVRGPSGGGKTSLLATWLARYPRPGVWVSLDGSARARIAFWSRLLTAVLDARLVPPGSILADLIPNAQVADSLRSSLQRGFAALPEPITIALDDFHEIDDAAVADDLHSLLRSTGNLRVVIGTRTVSPLEHPDQLARVDTAILQPNDLLLSEEEIAQAAEASGVDSAVAAELHTAFQGWPLPTRAALVELSGGRAESIEEAIARIEATDSALILDVSRADNERSADADYVRFVLHTSVAHQVTRSLAIRIGGVAAAQHLDRAEREGLGTWSSASPDASFVVHPYLRRRLERELMVRTPRDVRATRVAYAEDRAAHGDPLEAARQYVTIGDLRSVVTLIRRFYGDLVWVNHTELRGLLRAVDQDELRKHPELMAMMMLAGLREASAPRLGLIRSASLVTALAQARLGSGDPVDRITLLLVVMAGQRVGGHFDHAAKTAHRIARAAGALDDDGRAQLVGLLPTVWLHSATSFFHDDQPTRAEELFLTAADTALAIDRPWIELHASSMQSLVIALRGDITALAPRLEVDRARQRPYGWQGTYSSAGYHLAEALAALEQFDGEAARAQLAMLSPHEATLEHWPLIAAFRALSALVDGSPTRGLESLTADIAAHRAGPPVSRSMSALLASTRSDLLLADRQLRHAIDALRPLSHHEGTQLARARVDLVGGHPDRTIKLLAPAAWSEEHRPREKAAGLLAVGVAAHRLGQAAHAREATERALELLTTYSLRLPMMMAPRDDLSMILRDLGMEPDAVLAGVPDVMPHPVLEVKLTVAELRVLTQLPETGRIDELAAALHLSSNTIKWHLKQIYRKLGVRSRQEALGVAYLHRILSDRGPAGS